MQAKHNSQYHPVPPLFCAVVITRNPDREFIDRIKSIKEQVDKILIIDNASETTAQQNLQVVRQISGVSIDNLGENLGVAAALNKGVDRARELGFQWVLTLDQDSVPEPDMVDQLWTVYQSLEDHEKIVIIAPQIIDASVNRPALFLRQRSALTYERVRCRGDILENVSTVITSGSLMRITAVDAIGGFREDFFIDYVDTEFCLRAREYGYQILVACRARLQHNFGRRERVSLGPMTFYPSFHHPTRWYTINRNRVPMIRTYGLKNPYWLGYELIATGYILMRMLLTEDNRKEKLKAAFRGTWDGLRGRLGRPYWAA